jgi:hypothetical protein
MLPYRTDAVALSYIKTKGDSSLTLGCVWLFLKNKKIKIVKIKRKCSGMIFVLRYYKFISKLF